MAIHRISLKIGRPSFVAFFSKLLFEGYPSSNRSSSAVGVWILINLVSYYRAINKLSSDVYNSIHPNADFDAVSTNQVTFVGELTVMVLMLCLNCSKLSMSLVVSGREFHIRMALG